MDSITLNKVNDEKTIKLLGLTRVTKYIMQQITRVSLFDAELVFKSKDWPHLWRK